jgi:hypothetical protein
MSKKIIIPEKVIFEENTIKINIDGDENLEFIFPFSGEVSLLRITNNTEFTYFGKIEFIKKQLTMLGILNDS